MTWARGSWLLVLLLAVWVAGFARVVLASKQGLTAGNVVTGNGKCTITAGTTCSVATPGSSSASICQVTFQGGTTHAFACACAAGAGTTVVTCPAATTATLGVTTVN